MDIATVYSTTAFYVFGLAAIASGALMIFTRDLVRSALWLVGALGSIAALFVLLSADFLAVSQILIYIGAIVILMLFAIMLTPGQVDVPVFGRTQQLAAAVVAVSMFGVSVSVILTHNWKLQPVPLDTPTSEPLGVLLFSTYAFPLLIAGVLLTAVMIGALVLGRDD